MYVQPSWFCFIYGNDRVKCILISVAPPLNKENRPILVTDEAD